MEHNPLRKLQRNRFTLLELLAVMVVGAILLSITLQMGKQSPIKHNTRLVGSYIRLAQAKAISSNIPVAAIISEDDDANMQIGVYRWAYDKDDLKAMWISSGETNYRIWTEATDSYTRRALSMPNTSFARFSGNVKFATKSGTNIPISNNNSEYIIFKFNERGILQDVSNVAANGIKIQDENSEGDMTVSIDVFSGKISYDAP